MVFNSHHYYMYVSHSLLLLIYNNSKKNIFLPINESNRYIREQSTIRFEHDSN